MTRNEAREKIGLEPIDGADGLYISANLFPLTDEAVTQPNDPITDDDLDEYDPEDDEDEKALSDIDTIPTNGMKTEADKGLAWRKEFNRGGTSVGVARANQLSNKQKLSVSTIKRMYSFFARHESDKAGKGFRQGEEGYPSAGRIAWALWGGDAGQSWSKKKRDQIEREENS